MTGCFVKEPIPTRSGHESEVERLYKNLQLDARFYRWEFDLNTGQLKEGPLDDRNSEFPTVNDRWLTKPNRFSWHMDIDPRSTLRFQGLYGYDNHSGLRDHWRYPEAFSCSEAPFIPDLSPSQERNNPADENRGYVITFVTERGATHSEAHLFRADHLNQGPIARIHIPQRIPLGFHACWLDNRVHRDG